MIAVDADIIAPSRGIDVAAHHHENVGVLLNQLIIDRLATGVAVAAVVLLDCAVAIEMGMRGDDYIVTGMTGNNRLRPIHRPLPRPTFERENEPIHAPRVEGVPGIVALAAFVSSLLGREAAHGKVGRRVKDTGVAQIGIHVPGRGAAARHDRRGIMITHTDRVGNPGIVQSGEASRTGNPHAEVGFSPIDDIADVNHIGYIQRRLVGRNPVHLTGVHWRVVIDLALRIRKHRKGEFIGPCRWAKEES